MRKLYPSANENMLIVIAYEGMLIEGRGRGSHRPAHPAQGGQQQAGRLLALHRAADDRGFPPHHRHRGAGDGDSEFHRPAGGRHRRDEHHAGVGDRAHARNRDSQGGGRAQERHHRAIPDGGGGAHRHRRHYRPVPGLVRLDAGRAGLQEPADGRAVVGGRRRDHGVGRRGPVLRHLAGGPRGESGSGGCAPVRITDRDSRGAKTI